MPKKKMLTVRMDEYLYRTAKIKSAELGMPLATLIRVFLKSFTTQKGIGFYVGDEDLAVLINKWIKKRQFELSRGERLNHFFTPKLKDIFEL